MVPVGRLLVLKTVPKTELIKALSTGAGSVTTPSGLAHIAGYAEVAALDNTVQYVNGGDLQGNVWRFDLTDPTTSAGWKVQKLATPSPSAISLCTLQCRSGKAANIPARTSRSPARPGPWPGSGFSST